MNSALTLLFLRCYATSKCMDIRSGLMTAKKIARVLGEIVAVALIARAITVCFRKKKCGEERDSEYERDDHIKEMLEYLDGMALDIKEIHRLQNEQGLRIARLEDSSQH